ncbi:MAG: NAD(P)-binding protein [archaeon]
MGADIKEVENVIFKNVAITIGLIILLVVAGTYLYNVEVRNMQESFQKAISLVIHVPIEQSVNTTWFFVISIIGGILSIYIIFTIISLFYGGLLRKNMQEGNKMRKIKKMKNHIIICGGGRVGGSVAEEMKRAKKSFVIIEKDSSIVNDLEKKKYVVLEDNALEKTTLDKASIKDASTVLCCLDSDGNNLLLAIIAREANKNAEIVAKVDDPAVVENMKTLGINKVILPAIIGGKKMAEEVLNGHKPEV